jgi:hypothetical protein
MNPAQASNYFANCPSTTNRERKTEAGMAA